MRPTSTLCKKHPLYVRKAQIHLKLRVNAMTRFYSMFSLVLSWTVSGCNVATLLPKACLALRVVVVVV